MYSTVRNGGMEELPTEQRPSGARGLPTMSPSAGESDLQIRWEEGHASSGRCEVEPASHE